MKHKFLKFISVFLLLMSSLTAWAVDTWTTIYYAVDASTVGCYTVKINANIGDNNTWRSSEMTKTSYTYNGKIIYTGQVNEKYGGVDCLQIQLYEGNTWKSQQQPYSSWTSSSTYSGKMYVHNTGWKSYSTDASYTIYFVDKDGWGANTYAYTWNSNCDYNATWRGKAMTNTGKTYNGKAIYSYTCNKRYTKVIFNGANSSKQTSDLDCYSNAGKLYDYANTSWVDYNYDVTLTFNPQNGGANTTESVLKGGSITAPAAPSKTGYTFAGWGAGKVAAGGTISNVQADATYDAQWTPITYTVAYAGNDNTGGSTASSTHTYGVAKNLTANGFTREYVVTYEYDGATGGNSTASATATYTFKNWTCSANENTYSDGASVTNLTSTNGATVTMTAQWNSGSVTLPTPTKTGYTFSGWYNSDSKIGDGGASYTPTADITLTAHWTAKQTTITLDGNGATTAGTPTQITATYGQQLPALQGFVAPELTGYNFKGYYSATTDGTQYYNNAGTRTYDGTWANEAATATFYAQWENAATYSLTVATSPTTAFTASSGSAENITLGTPYPISATLAEKGYTFTGWTADPEANASFADKDAQSTTVTVSNGSVTVTANAVAKTTVLTLNGEGGTPESQSITATYGQSFPQDQGYQKPTRTGYNFNGYYITEQSDPDGTKGTKIILTDANGKFASGQTGWTLSSNLWGKETASETLHAHWTAKNYTLTLNKHYVDGSASNGSLKVTYDSNEATYTPCTSRTGYTLLGYTTAETEGTGFVYVVDAEGKLIAGVDGYTDASGNWVRDETITLYAQWQEILTTVALSTNPEGVANILISGKSQTSTTVGVATKPAISVGTPIDANAFTFKDWTLTNCSIVDNKLVGDGEHAEGSAVANFTLTSCKMRWSKTSSTFYDADGEPEMNYDVTTKAYYIDFTPTASPIYFRFKIGSAEYSADWNGSAPNIKTAVVNGSKLECNQDVHAWDTRATVKYAGCSSYPIRVWFDVKNKKTWITADAEAQWSIAGSKEEFGSWSTSKNVLVHETAGGVLWSLSINLKANTDYELKIVNRATGEYYGSTETITQSGTTTNALSTSTNDNLKLKSSLAGDYMFQWSTGTKKLKVTYPVINAVTASWNGWTKETNATVIDGVLTADVEITEEIIASQTTEALKFKIISDGTYYGASKQNQSMTPDNHTGWTLAAGGNGYDIILVPSIAGHYIFKYTIDGKGFEIEYPTLPSATTTTTEARYFGETPLTFIGGNGTENNPYQVYTDEKITITTTTLEAQDHLTAMYQFGEDEASAEVLTKTIAVTSADKQSIEVKAFYQVDGYNAKGETTAKTIYYQGVPYSQLFLTSDLDNDETELDHAPENVTISYTTANYTGSTTITKNDAAWQTATGEQQNYTEPLVKSIHADKYVATAEVNGRTFTTSLVVSVYRYVQVKVKDANPKWAKNVYMWKSGTDKKNAEWPGEALTTQLGDWYIFAVKYPTYDNFVINDGQEKGNQTLNLTIPDREICYEIGALDHEGDERHYYTCTEAAQCPNGLYVGDIANVEMYNGESTTVSPVVQLDPSLSEDNLHINFSYSNGGIVNAAQSGKNIMLSATSTGTTTVTATYSIDGAQSVSKTFSVTVTGAVLIQVSITTSLDWNNKDEIHIKYFNHGLDSEKKMKWDHFYNDQDYFSARIPVGSDGKIDFMIHAWQIEDEHPDHQTVDVQNVSTDGCYCVLTDQESNQKRKMRAEGSLCWEEYQVKIVMGNGTTYYSNKVNNLNEIVSFYAPADNESGYKRGSVFLTHNGAQVATITGFAESNVYTAKVADNGLTDINVYNGPFYIRTDATSWNDYKKPDYQMNEFSLYDGAQYNYYWVGNHKNSGSFNIKGCVANQYNESLANMIEGANYTDGYGNIDNDGTFGVNLRFGYNPETNHFERSILKGSSDNEFLNVIGDNIFNEEGCSTKLNQQNANSKFSDISNWVYEKVVYAKIGEGFTNAQVKLLSKAFNGKVVYQFGYTVDPNTGHTTETPATRSIMATGTTTGTYQLRLIYDYKTNRLTSAWSPTDNQQIDNLITVNADIMFMQKEHNDATRLLMGDAGKVKSLEYLLFILQIEKDKDRTGSTNNFEHYYISLPYDCMIQDIYGIEGFGEYWGIQKYDGAERARKGWFKEDTPEGFWKWMNRDDKLHGGEGYLLSVAKGWLNEDNKFSTIKDTDGKEISALRLYFPSYTKGYDLSKSSADESKEYPQQRCNITSPVDRRKEDSNWRMIGSTAYNDITTNTVTSSADEDHKLAANYLYELQQVGGVWKYVAVSGEGFTYKAFQGYMYQFEGEINWQRYTKGEEENPASAPRYEAKRPAEKMRLSVMENETEVAHTFVELNENATKEFDFNLDLAYLASGEMDLYTEIENANLAANVTAYESQVIALHVDPAHYGTYTFHLDGANNVAVYLLDNMNGTYQLLSAGDVTVELEEGSSSDRFALRFDVAAAPTDIKNANGETIINGGQKTQKLLINDQIYLINGGRVYNAMGVER